VTRDLVLGVFEMLYPNNAHPTWRHPRARADRYTDLDHWLGLAKLLDDAGLEFLFFADSYGYATDARGDLLDVGARHGVQFGQLDPMMIVTALTAATRDLGIVVTSQTTVEAPYASARRFATLDHLTRGRIGWNMVTGASPNSIARTFGQQVLPDHAARYDIADEFADICYQLWEGSWADDALRDDVEGDVWADPARIRPVEHRGAHRTSTGVFGVPPSPQRTPTLFQAGTSARGRDFAALHAEVVFLQGTSTASCAEHVADLRRRAEGHGRTDGLRVVTGVSVVVDPDAGRAADQRAELDAQFRPEDAAALYLANTGIDLLALDPDLPISTQSTEQGRTALERFTRTGEPTVAEVLERFRAHGLRGFQVTGDPASVGEQLAAIVEATGVDGFMFEPTFGDHGAFVDVVEHVLPELERRGLRTPGRRSTGTLRERMGGAGPRLPDAHPAAAHRWPAT
jgi:FMN-dependent oxidoreductase (nitrilotriacetate monooxygenase family)